MDASIEPPLVDSMRGLLQGFDRQDLKHQMDTLYTLGSPSWRECCCAGISRECYNTMGHHTTSTQFSPRIKWSHLLLRYKNVPDLGHVCTRDLFFIY